MLGLKLIPISFLSANTLWGKYAYRQYSRHLMRKQPGRYDGTCCEAVFTGRYHHEKTNPSITKKLTDCRPPHLSQKSLFNDHNAISLVRSIIRLPQEYVVFHFESVWWLSPFWPQDICNHHGVVDWSMRLKSPPSQWLLRWPLSRYPSM